MSTGAQKRFYFEEIIDFPGVRLWVRTTKLPLFNEDGKVCGILGVWQDITEFKKMLDGLENGVGEFKSKIESLKEKMSQ